MPLTNPGTGFDEDGWADAIEDIRRLWLMAEGGSNDLNKNSDNVIQAEPTPLPYLAIAKNLSDVPDPATARDNLGITDGFTAANVYLSGPSGTVGLGNNITWASEGFNSGGIFTSNLTTGAITVSEAGYYLATANMQMQGTAPGGIGEWRIRFYKSAAGYGAIHYFYSYYTGLLTMSVNATCIISASAGDTIAASVGTGGSIGSPAYAQGEFMIARVG